MTETWTEYSVELVLLSPIIINTGDSYGIMELYPYLGKDGARAYYLNMAQVLSILSAGGHVERFIDTITYGIARDHKESLRKARKEIEPLVQKSDTLKQIVRRPMRLLPNAYSKLLDNPKIEIQKISENSLNFKPYIPGSSIKGALRTAILEKLRDERKPEITRNSNQFEAAIMHGNGSPFQVSEDTFKYLKVSDFHFENKRTEGYIGELMTNNIPVYTAMTDAMCLHDNNQEILACGTISISSRAPEYLLRENILSAVNDFFLENYNKKHPNQKLSESVTLTSRIQQYENQGATFMRLGHYSGIENMTFKVEQDCRNNKKIHDPQINIIGGKCFPLIEGRYSPGYCILRFVGGRT